MNIIQILSLLLISIGIVQGIIIAYLYSIKMSEERQYSSLRYQLLKAIERFESSFQKFNETFVSIPPAPAA